MGMFDFLEMKPHEERKVKNFKGKEGLVVDTASVGDTSHPFETGITHPLYNDGEWIIVEEYDSKKDAKKGHGKWVGIMTAKKLPNKIEDVSTAEVSILLKQVNPKDGIHRKEKCIN